MDLQIPAMKGPHCTVGQVVLVLSSEDRRWLIERMIEHPRWTVLSGELLERTNYLLTGRMISRHAYGECKCGVILAKKPHKPAPALEPAADHRSWIRRLWESLFGVTE